MLKRSPFEKRLQQLADRALGTTPFVVWGLNYVSNQRRAFLRVFIDKKGGVTIADCETASRLIASELDVADVIDRQYTLEVSSPGINRVFFSYEQLATYQGYQVSLLLHTPLLERKKLQGELLNCTQQSLSIQCAFDDSEQEITVPIHAIQRARLNQPFCVKRHK